MKESDSEVIRRAVFNRDAMVYPALRDLIEGGYLDCAGGEQAGERQHICRLTERGLEAYMAAAKAWEQVR
jgi:DNA-binding PadR family transcriptional regulator